MEKRKKIINVGLIGLGTVGTGVARILLKKRRTILQNTGLDFRLKKVCVRHLKKRRPISLKGIEVTDQPKKLTQDASLQQIIELIGGLGPAERIIREALENDKDVISANKALFAERGVGIYQVSKRTRNYIGLEAAVCGGIPVIQGIKEGLASSRIDQFYGILNGTCNYILSQMSKFKTSYQDALEAAQKKGYAEQDPTLDVNGSDTAHKLAILARLAFKLEIDYKAIHCEGIEGITAEDIQYASEMGYSIKLLAIAKRHSAKSIELRVHPALLDGKHLLANIAGVNNGVLIHGDETGEVLFYGKGAGEKPTASAVVSDMISIALLSQSGIMANEAIYGKAKISKISSVESRYYLRFQCANRSGVMGSLTRSLGRQGISLSSVKQPEVQHAKSAPVVILTHKTREDKLRRALKKIQSSKGIKGKPVILRIEGREDSAV